ncbi:DNA mismatch repair endonuclease MutH [Salinivibrio costicola]|uniref:DNA mismatch repair endonuclease MutH n=1 Tax=Salinivibrio costicola TaxID=51367 RepID=UPI00157E066F|nr:MULTISPECIES: DNA mismatch repair endonuclease MutH [Salinivibrio]
MHDRYAHKQDRATVIHPPESEQILMDRALELAGLTLGEVSQSLAISCPETLSREKGWIGMLLETCLGANAGSKPEQDFAHLGIELKTIPVNQNGKPLETTFVCVAPLTGIAGVRWETSHVRQKLSRVLWVPVEGERDIPVAKRRIGTPLLWSPSSEEDACLRADWEELMDWVALGRVTEITARQGQYLQLRPKAANGSVLTDAFGPHGEPIRTLPRGFYLRTQFTHQILTRYFLDPQ